MVGDFICWCVLTPLAVSSTFLCIQGAVHYSQQGKDKVEVPGLVCLAVFLILTYFIWLSVSLRYHYKVWRQWQKKNQIVKIVDLDDVKRLIPAVKSPVDNNNNEGPTDNISANQDQMARTENNNLLPSQSMISVANRPPNHTSTPANPTSATVTIRFDYTSNGFHDVTTMHETAV